MRLNVFRELESGFELVGRFYASENDLGFSYAESYLASQSAKAISSSLPLAAAPFGAEATSAFFDGLLPEGSMRRGLSGYYRLEPSDVAGLLSRLNNESVGALVFKQQGEEPSSGRCYVPISADELSELALEPAQAALSLTHEARLSLAGAQRKVGLYHEGSDMGCGWHKPQGCAPTNYIVKIADGTFPNQTINEALCMLTAAKLGHEVAECTLIPVGNAEPLLAVKRFDRAESQGVFMQRLHQEDFCQALGLPRNRKYEPTEGNYANKCAALLTQVSNNAAGDRIGLFSALLFSWAVGNCDNHLKNYSLLWSADWRHIALSPLYDITCTLVYPQLEHEMGVSLCPSRRIDDVSLESIIDTAKRMGVGKQFALNEYRDLCLNFERALRESEAEIAGLGFDAVSPIADFISTSFKERC